MTELYDVKNDATTIENKALKASHNDSDYLAEKGIAELLLPHLGDQKYFAALKVALSQAHANDGNLPEVTITKGVVDGSETHATIGSSQHRATVAFQGGATILGKRFRYSEELALQATDGEKTGTLTVDQTSLTGHSHHQFDIKTK